MIEIQVIDGCINNDRKSQEFLYNEYNIKLKNIIKKYTTREEVIDEILNNGYLRIFKYLHQFKHQGSLEGWMRKIMVHAVYDYFQHNKKYHDNIFLSSVEIIGQEEVHGKLNYEQILQLIETLPPATSNVIKLNIKGLTHKEIGSELGINEGTSKWHLSTGRQILKEKLNKLDSYINLIK
jgi:RNA polymerase sigma-70 factor (ECF subfamily)